MDEIILAYKRLLRLLEEEYEKIGCSLEGDYLEKYRSCLSEEMQIVTSNLRALYK